MKVFLVLQYLTSVASFIPCGVNYYQQTSSAATSNLQQQLGEFEKLNIQDNSKINSINSSNNENNNIINVASFNNLSRSVRLYDLSASDPIEYRAMWEVQKSLVNSHVNRLKVEFQKTAPEPQFMNSQNVTSCCVMSDYTKIPEQDERIKGCDSLILLQHQPVYTLGTGSDPQFLKLDEERLEELGIDLIRIERGGEITYHGPGQLTVYPIFDLRGYKQDIHW
jgi:hypothetical protein